MSESFRLLSETMQHTIWNKGWQAFTDIQERAIPALLHGNGDVLILSETASGKTEAAFLPILTLVESTAPTSLRVLYVSPLKALINDQFQRIQELCELTNIPTHRWHGDVAQTAKKRLLQKPAGILQITPESVESLFINHPEQVRSLFAAVEFIVIDEAHAFMGTARGTQVRSLISRVTQYSAVRPRLVALSATVGSTEYARRWLAPDAPDQVAVVEGAPSGKETRYCLLHTDAVTDDGGNGGSSLPVELLEDMRALTRECSSLIFCNSRGTVEEVCVFLNRLADREKAGEVYLPHHASLAPLEREFAERTIRESSSPRSLVCTSTLELGVDIGQIDLVMQLDATFSVASLKQRLGRSGRRVGAPRMFQLYSTTRPGLLQAIAVTQLFLQGWVEEFHDYARPYDVLWQQIVSICAECNGLTLPQLLERIRTGGVFATISDHKMIALVDDMLQRDFLERVPGRGEIIVGIEGERILRSKDFYAVFQSPPELTVLHQARTIGTVSPSPFYAPGANLILAGKNWTIQEVDEEGQRLYVLPAVNGKRPTFVGHPSRMHHRIRSEMARAAQGDQSYPYLFGTGQQELASIRSEYRNLEIGPEDRAVVSADGKIEIRAFAGDVLLNTLSLMLKASGVDAKRRPPSDWGWLSVEDMPPSRVVEQLERLKGETFVPEQLVPEDQVSTDSKYGVYLPAWAQREMYLSAWVDIPGTQAFLHAARWCAR